jgi:AraC family transcriptional regulator, ethanolamine operon transcriptional activator
MSALAGASPLRHPHAAAICSGHYETHDFDEQAALLKGWNQDYAQISSGRFSGYVSEIQFDDVYLFLEYTSQSLFQSGQLGAEVIAVGVPLATSNQGMFCGETSEAEAMHVFSGQNGFEFFSPSELVMSGISVARSAVLGLLAPEEQQLLQQNCRQAHVQGLEPGKIAAMREFMSNVFRLAEQSPSLLQKRDIAASLRSTVLALLADCLVDQRQVKPDLLSPSKCWNIIADSRELVRSRAESPVSVAELCQHLGISRRTLQYCFQNVLDTSPVAYLRAERLNGVRRMLKDANSVTEAAAYWGFWHFGHFSQEYKKMFGELPSATFKRLRALH